MSFFVFASLCSFPKDEVDFGWGEPAFVGATALPFRNVVAFFDTKYGDGIEAWVNLEEEDMAKCSKQTKSLSLCFLGYHKIIYWNILSHFPFYVNNCMSLGVMI